jgi:transposase
MVQPIMIGCDLHDKTMLLRIAQGRECPQTVTVPNTRSGRERMIADLRKRAQAACDAPLIFAYEASGQGFGLYDELTDAGMGCHVLAPTKIARSSDQKRQKTDEKDAQAILELLRAHVLAGNALPDVWIPHPQIRDDRELVRTRLDAAEKLAAIKAQVKGLLKRNQKTRPEGLGSGWTRGFIAWLRVLSKDDSFGEGRRAALASLLRQLDHLQHEMKLLDAALAKLSRSPRYANQVNRICQLGGVGCLTAMVFLAEVGDLKRFANRRQIAAYLGLAPSSFETGDANDRKGHVTRQGPSRVRKVLCQATWARIRNEGPERDAYQRIVEKNPKKKKIAVVASMRRLAVKMWHRGCEDSPLTETVATATGCSASVSTL